MRSAYYATICGLSLKGEYGILSYNKDSRKGVKNFQAKKYSIAEGQGGQGDKEERSLIE
jgi:hypothetical protein